MKSKSQRSGGEIKKPRRCQYPCVVCNPETDAIRCSIIDYAAASDFFKTTLRCIIPGGNRAAAIQSLKQMWDHPVNHNHVLPCLSVRTALDLYLKVMAFPKGSEIIISAINIPDMLRVIKEHNLAVVPLDISCLTTTPKLENLEHLITDRTCLMIMTHIYGKRYDLSPFVAVAKKYKLPVIEDCAEVFTGLDYTGHPGAELSLFSFGTIKNNTSFGGAIVKIKDRKIFQAMEDLYSKYPVQPRLEYLKKVLKYFPVYLILNKPWVNALYQWGATNLFNMDPFDQLEFAVKLMRGFPSDMITKIRHQPCTPLLQTMAKRHKSFHPDQLILGVVKGNYVAGKLPANLELVGRQAESNNYWLFPVLAENPDELVQYLISHGISAYRGATQLGVIESTEENRNLSKHENFTLNCPHEAKYLMDHVIYLPVNKLVPFRKLREMCDILRTASEQGKEIKMEWPELEELSLQKLKLKSKL